MEIRQIINSYPNEIIEILTTGELPPIYHNYTIRYITDGQFHDICHAKTPQGPLAVVNMPPAIYSNHLPKNAGNKIVLLEDIQDPGNVGTLIRTASAFGFSGIILTQKCANPLAPKCVQSTAGAILAVWIRRTANHLELMDELQRRGYYIVATDLDGLESPAEVSGKNKLLLALGNEASGLSADVLKRADYRFRIPIDRDKVESLNVAACGAICIYLSTASRQ